MSWWANFLVLFLISGCGYSLTHRLKGPFTDPKGIFVPVLSNQTEETGAERAFTDALIREIQSRGDIELSTRAAGARELRGAITGISYAPTAFTEAGFKGLQPYRRLPTELGVTVTMSLSLVDPVTNKTLWAGSFSSIRRIEAPLGRTHNYEAPSSVGPLTQSLIEFRYEDIARDIVRDVYDDMVELF